jgi:VWFA-related protein
MPSRAAIVLVLTCTSAAAAQDPAVFRSSTEAVVVPVSVRDSAGRFVQGLTADQFEILEGRARHPVTQFSSERVPVSLVILLDISGSTAENPQDRAEGEARWADTRRALELLVSRLDASDEVLFAAFSDRLAASPWTQEHGLILGTFDSLRTGGGTADLEAVRQIVPFFEIARHQRKALLLISDGNDTQIPAAGLPPLPHSIGDQTASGNQWGQAVRTQIIGAAKTAVRKSEAMAYAIGIGTRKGVPVDRALLDNLTKESGGYAEPLRNPGEISAAVARICDDLQSQYLLAFEPGRADGEFHEIRVRTKNSRLRVRARAGYVAPSAAPK